MCKGTCNIHKFEIFLIFSHNIQNLSFSGCLFRTKQKAQASFAEYIMFSKMCMGLIFHGKKGNGSYLFGLSNKVNFLGN